MSNIGKRIRMERFFRRDSKKTILIPMDHGISLGQVPGLENFPEIVNTVAKNGANGVVGHKGFVKHGFRGYGPDIGFILQLSGSTTLGPEPDKKVILATVEEAIRLGADGVSTHINIGSDGELKMLYDLGKVSAECEKWGMPLIAMVYPRGKKIMNEYDPTYLAHSVRLASEMGADIVKINYTGDVDSFKNVVSASDIPVIIAGGKKMESETDLLQMVAASIEAKGSGVAIGRNVFQSGNPGLTVRRIAAIVHDGWTVEEAMKLE
ncbi:MAG: class I fructose-bisphosphate aldolase family protein [Methanosarcinaceae archaeon]|nr:class I fructose-bisphosphate aldolase family protein [Methanosarcinaceae archaeon]